MFPSPNVSAVRGATGSSGFPVPQSPPPLPSGVTLQAIDGGPQYYASGGFTYAASPSFNGMSWDDPRFFPIGQDYCFYPSHSTSTFFDLGLNFTHRTTSDTDLSVLRSAGVWVVNAGDSVTNLGAETVGWHVEEPDTWNASQFSIANQVSAFGPLPGRFLHVSCTWNQLYYENISGAPGDSSMPYVMGSPIPAVIPAGNIRRPVRAGPGGLRSRRIMVRGGTVTAAVPVVPPTPPVHLNIPSDDLYYFASGGTAGGQLQGGNVQMNTPSATADQMDRGTNYGDMVDIIRHDWLSSAPASSAPVIAPYIETEDGLVNGGREILPAELNWAVWSTIIHGARGILYFSTTSNFGSGATFGFSQSLLPGQTVTMYAQGKNTNTLVANLARVINSAFALNYATVSPSAYTFPVPLVSNASRNGWGFTGIDIMAKYYAGATFTNAAGTFPSGFYVFATYRGSGTAANIAATFTTAGGYTGAVTAINADGGSAGYATTYHVAASGGVFSDTFAAGSSVRIYYIPRLHPPLGGCRVAAQEIFADQPSTTATGSSGTTSPSAGTQETWTVTSSASFPAASSSATPPTQFHVADALAAKQSEIVTVINVSGTTWTVIRGAEGTTPVAHSTGFIIRQVVTSGWLNAVTTTGSGAAYQFYVSAFGAKGDGQIVTDGAITSGTNTLACATSVPFANAAHGMPVHVAAAGGGAYTPLCTTINTVTNSGHVVLTANATSTPGGTGAIVYFGTDDTAAIQNCLNAAVAYAQAHDGYAEVIFDPVTYIIGTAATTGASGNAQITLPLCSTTAEKVTIVFRGTREQTALSHWLQTTPQASGTILACARYDPGTGAGGNSATNGPAFVVGGPVNGYGGGSSTFTNFCPVIDGVGILVPYNGSYGGWGFFGCAEAVVKNSGVFTAAIPPASSAPVPTMSNPGTNISNQYPIGLQMPDVNNNDNCFIEQYSCEGLCIGLQLSEHGWFTSVQLIYCLVGIQVGSWSGTPMPHTCGGAHASIEIVQSGIVGLGATSNVLIERVDFENDTTAVYDPSNFLTGIIGVAYNGTPGYGSVTVNSATAVRILDLRQPSGPVGSPQAPPATTVAWVNSYYRDAWVTVSLSGGNTFTSLKIDATAQPNAAGAGTYGFVLPSGHSYTPAYAAGVLSHTVTLL